MNIIGRKFINNLMDFSVVSSFRAISLAGAVFLPFQALAALKHGSHLALTLLPESENDHINCAVNNAKRFLGLSAYDDQEEKFHVSLALGFYPDKVTSSLNGSDKKVLAIATYAIATSGFTLASLGFARFAFLAKVHY